MKTANIAITIFLVFSFMVVYSNPSSDSPSVRIVHQSIASNIRYIIPHKTSNINQLRKYGIEDSSRWQKWMDEEERKRFERKVMDRNRNKRLADLCQELDADCSLFYNPKKGHWQLWEDKDDNPVWDSGSR